MNVGSLFSGIGGLDLGLERAGMHVRWQCEIDPYCRAVLAYHWPGLVIYDDIRAIDESAERIDLICGGFPCQPVSLAGKGLAQEDPRWLWPEFARVVGLLRPRYVLVENVPGLVRRGLADVVGDLAEMGYDAEWQIVSAASVGSPHLRERIIVVAYAGGSELRQGRGRGSGRPDQTLPGVDGEARNVADAAWHVCEEPAQAGAEWERVGPCCPPGREGEALADSPRELLDWAGAREPGRREPSDGSWWLTEPEVGRVADGVPNRVAQLRALGNAVVPQVAEFVGRLILEAEGAASDEAAA